MSDTPLVWGVGDRNPSITDVITVGGVVQNLTGKTGTFKMRQRGSSTLKVNQPVSNALDATGAVRYDWAATDVDTEGIFDVWWEITSGGKIQHKQEAIIEFISHGLPSGWLVEMGEVKQAMEIRAADTKLDDDIRRLIPVASKECIQFCDREFAPATAGLTRRFRTNGRLVSLAPFDLRTATTITFDPVGGPVVLTSSDFRLQPTHRPDGVYTEIRISDLFAVQTGTWVTFDFNEVDVLGDWGFLTVPVDVKEAAIIAIRSWLRRDTTTYANVDPELRQLQPEPYGTYKLPPASKSMLDSYRRMVV